MPIIEINPMRCRMWALHPRIDERITDETCGSLIKSMRRHGQIVPALGRRLRDNRDHDIELIYGARRLFAARYLDRPLRVDLREVSERDGIVAMETENRLRKDISAYERGTSYDRWLREGHFATQKDLCRTLQVSAAQLSRLLNLSRLPRVLVETFGSPADLCEVWGAQLAILLKDPAVERRLLQAAEGIRAEHPRPPAQEIFERLRSAGRTGQRADKRIVKSGQGDELFSVSRQRGSIVLSVGVHLLCERRLKEIEAAIVDLVATETPNAVATH
jgi:ParB family chromosome partitioning protein